ncbi:MAG TPA: hypothetical protein PKD59_11240 [Miltoncostaeaceae bacterium]|nr:hypothetical protein [Miltoncostaeaceae bacterium]
MGRRAGRRGIVDGMAWLVLLAICSAYGAVAFAWLAGLRVPAGRAAAGAAWSTLVAFVGLGVPLLLLAVSCIGDGGAGASAQVCREVQEGGASRLQLVFAAPLVSTAIMIAAFLAFARSRRGGGLSLFVAATAAAVILPTAFLDALAGGLAG